MTVCNLFCNDNKAFLSSLVMLSMEQCGQPWCNEWWKSAGHTWCYTCIYLYTNIPHEEGLDACREILNTRGFLDPLMDNIIHLITLILKMSNFSFDDLHYLQKHRTAMGTRMALSFANIFMRSLESEVFQWVTDEPFVWWRYLHDVFTIWLLSEESLGNFSEWIKFKPPLNLSPIGLRSLQRESVTFLSTELEVKFFCKN